MIHRYIHRNPSKNFFLERTGFPADKISSRVSWKFRGGMKVQKGLPIHYQFRRLSIRPSEVVCQFDLSEK